MRGRAWTRRAVLVLAGLVADPVTGTTIGAEDAAGREPPNVLLLVADDLGPRLGCYGDAQARTPHIDRLAERGVRFTRAYCQGTTCNPSRTSFLTGQRPGTTGIFENSRWSMLELLALPEHFQAQGYHAVKAGKLFHPEKARTFRSKSGAAARREKRRGLWSETLRGLEPAEEDRRAGFTGHDAELATAAVRFLEREHERPFLLAVGFSKPHLPFDAPAPYFERIAAEGLVLPHAPADDLEDLPPRARQLVGRGERLAEADHRAQVHGYYACVAYLDECIGRILAALDARGLRDETVVVLMSDHGLFLGEHNLWRKGALFEDCLRVPLIVSAPGRAHDGSRGAPCERLVENVDLLPTLTELCGIPAPPRLEGTSLVPLLVDPQRAWKRAAFSYEPTGTTMRTERWRFTLWKGGGVELYDHAADPGEHRNLAASEDLGATLVELRGWLDAGWAASLPN